MIWTCSAPQNDRLNFCFVKYIKVVVEKMARNCRKMTIYHFVKKKLEMEIFVFCVITFELIKI